MNTNTILKIVGLSLLICSCKKDLEPQESSQDTIAPVVQTLAPDASAVVPPQADVTAQTMSAPQPQMQQPQQTQPVAVAPGMNPAHGQPNHRCDIAVGAPLNSPQKMAAKPAMTINPSDVKTSTPPVISTKPIQVPAPANGGAPAILSPNAAPATAVGMNPAHGQPGHKCEVAVGAPLPK